jgi:disulfide bond formation protein DsbB
MQTKPNFPLFLAWFISLFAFCFTLYSSEILHYPVCNLCWYQRICLYPLVLLLGMATYKNETSVIPYALPLPVIGSLFALYHYIEQNFPQVINFIPLCSVNVPCSTKHFNLLGFVSYPLLSFTACISLIILLMLAKKSAKN